MSSGTLALEEPWEGYWKSLGKPLEEALEEPLVPENRLWNGLWDVGLGRAWEELLGESLERSSAFGVALGSQLESSCSMVQGGRDQGVLAGL